MIFHRSINFRRKKRKVLIVLILLVFLLIVLFFHDFSFRVLNRAAFYIFSPLLKAKLSIEKKWEEFKIVFSDKKNLQNENKILKEKLTDLEDKNILADFTKKENDLLKKFFSAEEKKEFIVASVIFRPPQIPYDTLIIDSGSDNGVKEGMQVSAFGNVLLGYATDIQPNTSKIKLISSFGEETNVLLGFSGIPAIAIGKGGENFEITLPRNLQISVGEPIITLGKNPMLTGVVEKIERNITDPFQKIIFRLPLNIQYLNQVFVLKK